MNFHSSLSARHFSLQYDVIIVGAGAAGLSAALWCDELGLKTLLLEERAEIGGQLLKIYNRIENHLGAETAADGRELKERFAAQIVRREFLIRTAAKVAAIDLSAKQVELENGERIGAKFLILATGVRRRQLNVAGEEKFRSSEGGGWLESGKRDASLVAGKRVCIVGGGDAAAENALILAAVAKKVYLVHRRPELRARQEFLKKIKHNSAIEILTETKVLEIIGDRQITGVKLQKNNSSESFEIIVDAVLLRIGVDPNSELFRDQLKTTAEGYIAVNSNCETNIKGVFAVGDVANQFAPTISSAVGMGATAAKAIAAQATN